MYVRCDESSLYSRINYVHSPDGELHGSVQNNLKRCTQGLACTRIVYANASVLDIEETLSLWFSVERFAVFWMLSVNSNELSKVHSNIFYVHGYL